MLITHPPPNPTHQSRTKFPLKTQASPTSPSTGSADNRASRPGPIANPGPGPAPSAGKLAMVASLAHTCKYSHPSSYESKLSNRGEGINDQHGRSPGPNANQKPRQTSMTSGAIKNKRISRMIVIPAPQITTKKKRLIFRTRRLQQP